MAPSASLNNFISSLVGGVGVGVVVATATTRDVPWIGISTVVPVSPTPTTLLESSTEDKKF